MIITDKLKSYGAAQRESLPGVEHRQHRYLNHRAEHSHQPTRQRERRMQAFKSAGPAQRFLATYGPIAQHFRPRWHRLSGPEYRSRNAAKMPGVGGDHGRSDGCLRVALVRSWSTLVLLLSPNDLNPNKLSTPYSVLDLKADCRGYKYVEETITMLPEKPAPILLRQILHKVAGLGRIHASPPSFSFS